MKRSTDELIKELYKIAGVESVNYNGSGWTVKTQNGSFYSTSYTGIKKMIKGA